MCWLQKYLVICKCVLFGFVEKCYDKDEQQGVGFSEVSSTENIQVPDDFKCPISLDLMRDPAIVATGQTYDRVSITRWIEEGHCACPKLGQKLLHMNMIPNHALRSLICQWCEKNDVPFEKPESIPSLVPSMYTLLIYRETSPQITYTLVMEMQLIMSVCESVVCTIDLGVYKDIPAIVREANASPLGEGLSAICHLQRGDMKPFYFDLHGIALVLHLIFIASFAVSRILTLFRQYSSSGSCSSVSMNRPPEGDSELSTSKIQYGYLYKLTLGCCLLLFMAYAVAGLWRSVDNWYVKGNLFSMAASVNITQAVAWLLVCLCIRSFPEAGAEEEVPILISLWWTFSFFFQAAILVMDIILLGGKTEKTPYKVCVDALPVLPCTFLLYIALRGRISGTVVSNHSAAGLAQPLLNKTETEDDQLSPYSTSSIWSLMTFCWLNPLFSVGYKKPLELEDVPKVVGKDSAREAYVILQTHWCTHKKVGTTITESPSMAKAILLSVWKSMVINALYAAAYTCATYIGPYLIDVLVEYLGGAEHFTHEGYVLASAFFGAKMVESLAQRQWYFGAQQLGLRVRSGLTALIYRKGLCLSNRSRQNRTSGEIINYMSVDVERIGNFAWYMHDIWLLPVQVFLALVVLYKTLGLSCIAGLAAIVAVMVGNTPFARLQERYQDKIMEAKDKRMRATSETLKNMRTLKLQAWETKYLHRLQGLRGVEQGWLRRYLYISAVVTFLYWAAPTIVSVATFGSCVLMGIPLTAGRVLSALATFRILQTPIYNLPELVSMLAQTKVSLDRISTFLQEEEIQSNAIENIPEGYSTDIAIEIKDAEFSWDHLSKKSTLRGINLHLTQGMKVAICGSVGSGKSSLLAGILGEIPKLAGIVKIRGTKAYVPQTPWIQTGKIEDNILFGKMMDRSNYENVLEACALNKDLHLFSHGDQTEIGERGINLSGGQKQRIQLARSIYQDADIYLLDDPFSAVDAHTGTLLFNECLHGILKSKTIVYATHQMEFLPASDLILVMHDGMIAQVGRYEDLLQSSADILELIGAHHQALHTVGEAEKGRVLIPQEDIIVTGFCNALGNELEEVHKKEAVRDQAPRTNENKLQQIVQVEERETGRVKLKVYSAFITAAYKGALIPIILAAQIMFQVLQIGSNYWMAWSTPPTENQKTTISSTVILLVYIVLAIGSSVCVLASSDQSTVDTDIPYRLGGLAFAVIQLFGIVIVMSEVAWQVFVVLIPVVIICIWYQHYYIASARELARLVSIRKAPVIHHFAESISGAAIVRSFNQETRFMNTNLHLIDDYSRPFFHNNAAMEWLCLRLNFMSNLVFLFSLMFLVSLPKGTIDPSLAGLAVTYGLDLNIVQAWVIWNLCNVENKMISVERILQYSNIPSEAPLVIESSRPTQDWPSLGTIVLQNLQVRYSAHLPFVLKGITCEFPGGTKVGIVGRTGSGKSTLLQALFRIVEPTRGRILIDGVDISMIGLHDLRSKLSIIPQDPTLFEGTIRNNLDPLEEHSDTEIWEALDKCQLGALVRSSKQKLDTSVTENGENWSVGQRQLVCLGRALLKQSHILVLDEATASVDTATDNTIQRTLRSVSCGYTVITIAHRIPTVIDSDRVLVLSE
ncbi:hypothetical protein KI387_003303, partial [Taxus chinensis]